MLHFLVRCALLSLLLPLSVLSTLKCELYIAESTIPNAGIGIFSGVAKSKGDTVGNGDKAIPLFDIYINNDFFWDGREDPTQDYIWDGMQMGMGMETYSVDAISAFWPGVDAMVNSHLALANLGTATPVYDDDGMDRSKHPGAGSISPYNAGDSVVTRYIPMGGEIFKEYGEEWFTSRPHLGNVPLEESYSKILGILKDLVALVEKNDGIGALAPIIYDEIIREFKITWDSRTLNALHDFDWNEIQRAMNENDMRPILQPNATRSIEWLDDHGKCIDHIVPGRSTIDGAGSGAFAKRDLPKDTIVTGTPVLVFVTSEWFDQYIFQICPDGEVARDPNFGPVGTQLLLNYCFGHPESTILLCPYGAGVNYINHSKTKANVRIQWPQNEFTSHKNESLYRPPSDTTKVSLDYVALRDIAEGEELFLDYGDIWEQEWKRHSENWASESSFDDYVSATNFNRLYGKESILTPKEQGLVPYPVNLEIRCHWLVCESDSIFAQDSKDTLELFPWDDWAGENLGCKCDVLGRNDNDESYWVEVTNDEDISHEVFDVPREAIKFADLPYTTDLHLDGAFRQPLGIPDEILPDAWRNVKHCSPGDPSCEMAQKSDRIDDPCDLDDDDDDGVYNDSFDRYYDYLDEDIDVKKVMRTSRKRKTRGA